MSVIGIDPGTKCGWCVRHDGGSMDSGTWNLKGGGMRFLRMRQLLRGSQEVIVCQK